MTRDDIIRMAQRVGMSGMLTDVVTNIDELERFAYLVAAKDREESAKLLEEMAAEDNLTNRYQVAALAIRARGDK
jgi:hypothetical protein